MEILYLGRGYLSDHLPKYLDLLRHSLAQNSGLQSQYLRVSTDLLYRRAYQEGSIPCLHLFITPVNPDGFGISN
jgi:hypothetical protein